MFVVLSASPAGEIGPHALYLIDSALVDGWSGVDPPPDIKQNG